MKRHLKNTLNPTQGQGVLRVDNISASRYIPHVRLPNQIAPLISTRYLGKDGILFQADCLDLLANIRSSTIDLVFADPPFNLGKRYEDPGASDQHLEEAYRGWCHTWLLESIRVLKPGGALMLYHLPRWLMDLGAWLQAQPEVNFRNWVALKMKAGFPIKGRLHPAHYGLLYFTKRGASKFNVVRSKSPTCRKCGALHRDYGGYRDKYRNFEEEGIPWIQISDFWEDTRPATFDKAREVSINELSFHIPERAILMATNPKDVVLDCFSGAGSTIHAAKRNNRRWIAGDFGDSTAALRRIKTLWPKDGAAKLPKPIASCFQKKFRDILPNYLDSSELPITKAEPLPSFDKKEIRDTARSKVFPPKILTKTRKKKKVATR
jgi:site-specific DNA-methyltransferase (adenine-specific)